MLFNSLAFLVFFPLVFAIYWAIPRSWLRIQNCLLLAASYVFYGWWDWRFLILIVISSVVDFIAGQRIHHAVSARSRRSWLMLSIGTNLGLLGFFKYFNFFVDSFIDLVSSFGLTPNVPLLQVVLPVGISFYTFQTLSYSIDIYRGKIAPTRDPISFFAFVAFFPQLVAGPIERAANLLPQFHRARTFEYNRAVEGSRLILWGFFKKLVVADRLALLVEPVYSNPESFGSLPIIVATLAFALQIYCDFSGYSDIAIGIARLLGFDLMTNFRTPYFARSIREFWQRWHISLSTWFRDYVYIPLGGNRVGYFRHLFNIFATFVLSGLWHGANWTFVVWGALHGSFLVVAIVFAHWKQKARNGLESVMRPLVPTLQRATVFFLVTIGWVFFRSPTIGGSLEMLRKTVTGPMDLSGVFEIAGVYELSAAALSSVILLLVDSAIYFELKWHGTIWSRPLRWATYIGLGLTMLVLGRFSGSEFIYFQF